MDPITLGAIPQASFGSQEPPIPAAPDATDVQEFNSIYGQETPQNQIPGQGDSFKGMVINLVGGPVPGVVTDNVFQAAMSHMVEMHENSCAKIESLVERIASSSGLSPSEMLEAQLSLTDATTGLATYQSFDKKTDEGIKALMTGQ
ncbi:MAG: hypothetical protein JWP91_2145 [Fibrobacteres bacterium]|nr:hypothetical protein [Fibrobacterota bacterium]